MYYLLLIAILCAIFIGTYFKNKYQIEEFKQYCQEQVDESKEEFDRIVNLVANNKSIYHVSLVETAIERYDKSSVEGNMTIQEFVELTCKDILNEVVEQTD